MLQNKQFKTPQHVLTVATLLLVLAIAAFPSKGVRLDYGR